MRMPSQCGAMGAMVEWCHRHRRIAASCRNAAMAWMPIGLFVGRRATFRFLPLGAAPHHSSLTRLLANHPAPFQLAKSMCEFCSFGPNSSRQNHGEDAFGMGFFSADAIEAAVRQATEAKQRKAENSDEQGDGEDDDGT